MLKYVFFDMDGTLLPMDLQQFIAAYFSSLSKYLLPYGYKKSELVEAMWQGTLAMTNNDGKRSNCDVFWDKMRSVLGKDARADEDIMNKYYVTSFDEVRAVCGFDPLVAPTVKALKDLGLKLVLASNPFFPEIGQRARLKWTGADPEDFSLFTSYELMHFSKPNPRYYEEILSILGASPDECLMAGNDVAEDMVARTLGIDVFLLPACLINRSGEDISRYPHGDFGDLLDYVKSKLGGSREDRT